MDCKQVPPTGFDLQAVPTDVAYQNLSAGEAETSHRYKCGFSFIAAAHVLAPA